MSSGEPTTIESCDARSRLLSAAGPIFAKHGFDRSTLREISGAAGVNLASVGYYFGDKMGLYREVVRQLRLRRETRYPLPPSDEHPGRELAGLVRIMLTRMLAQDGRGWESELLMREMQDPTAALEEIVNESFRPLFERLVRAIDDLTGASAPDHVNQQLALSVVGQCLYYRVGREVIDILIPRSDRAEHYDIESVSRHIISVTLCAAENAAVLNKQNQVHNLLAESVTSAASIAVAGECSPPNHRIK